MNSRNKFKPIQDAGKVRHESSREERFKDLVYDKTHVRCEVLIKKDGVILTTKSLADYFLAKSVLKGSVSLEISRDQT